LVIDPGDGGNIEMNVGTLEIEALIVHDVPLHKVGATDNEEIDLSEVPSELDTDVRNLFTERLKRSLTKNHYEVERDTTSTSPVPDLMENVVNASTAKLEEVLVAASQTMAQHLFSTQTGSNNAALLIVCRAKVDGKPAATIMKLEREDALHLRHAAPKGKRTFGMNYLRDLMLGKNTKVFKAALFTFSNGKLDGIVSDNQKSDPSKEVADFFLHRFLGAQLKTAPDVATKSLFVATQGFINTLPNPEKQARYEIALLATMNSPTKSLKFGAIGSQFDTQDRKPYEQYLIQADAPTGSFDKDTRLIAAQLKQLVFGFKKTRLRLSGPYEEVQKVVKHKQGKTEIDDEVKDVRGGSR
jgi:hypothetical protein